MAIHTVKSLVDQVFGYHVWIMTVRTARLIHISIMQARMVCCTVAVETGHGKAVLAVVDHIGVGRIIMAVRTEEIRTIDIISVIFCMP